MHSPASVVLFLGLGPWTLAAQSPTPQRPAPAAPEAKAPPPEPRFAEPRADDDAGLMPLLDCARTRVTKGADGAALLAEPEFAPLHELGPFRRLVRDHAPVGAVRITLPDEPGAPLRVTARVVDTAGAPVVGALVYAYHTSSAGWYSDRAPHFSGNGGDDRHARLFAWMRTDDHGAFALQTIRPGGYPRSTLPEHIHVHVVVQDEPLLVTELLFADDARLDAAARERARRDRFVVAEVARRDGGEQAVDAVFEVDLARLKAKATPTDGPRRDATGGR